jgi:hypothetical protein
MLREVKLYTVREQTVMAGDYVELREVIPDGRGLGIVGDGCNEVHIKTKLTNLPVHRVVGLTRNAKDGRITQHRVDREDLFIAMDPKLEEILRAPFIGEIAGLNHQLVGLSDRFGKVSAKLQDADRWYDELVSQPWWRRVWRAIRKFK